MDERALVLEEEEYVAPGAESPELDNEEAPAEFVIPSEYEAVSQAPDNICKALEKSWLLMNWEITGWEMGQIKHFYPRGVILRDSKKVALKGPKGNVMIKWAMDASGLFRDSYLDASMYSGSPDAPIGSWVLLKRKA